MPGFFDRQATAYRTELKSSTATLLGMITGFLADDILSNKEIEFLNNWMDNNSDVSSHWPGDVLHMRLKQVLEDGKITESERTHLVETLSALVDGRLEDLAENEREIGLLPDDVEEVQFAGSSFCLSGQFVFGPRKVCQSFIVANGGHVIGDVTPQLDYLVIGGLGSPDWKHGQFGRKLNKAIKYRQDGTGLIILHEDVWASAIADSS
jgi:NAD-dependent DNA ligase